MNNSFESIRKLALSKLSQFKFIMTIVMYLAAVIPLLSLGYLMGKTTPESSKWLLEWTTLLSSIGSLLGGLATVFAAWVAFGAYGAWKKQITHPEMFKNDMKIMKEILSFHYKHINYFDDIATDIERSIVEYETDRNNDHEYYQSKFTDEIDEYNRDISGRSLTFSEIDKVRDKLLNNISCVNNNDVKIVDSINSYFDTLEKILAILHSNLSYKDYAKTDYEKLGEIKKEGGLFNNLEVFVAEIKNHYNSIWFD
ncbi:MULTISPECIES: hypothetical protein [Photobacterium]|uniref:hypothetical protein n=1 Tax=Photobacterium TaxID=657 RepID=UPI001E420B2A|nr:MULTISPECIES: hypothetical protein [Photobacterium]MCD9467517.1 hypothetical protein [Photobacterium iliopiscarium]MCD9488024.1 hypothetical protein [Photobacterium iliopiscarium]MCD9515787.1 hypothetical protein [Photobacterium carnosum]MCF2244005.1 hypothetical protein [Photobacterium iliopiscarium]